VLSASGEKKKYHSRVLNKTPLNVPEMHSQRFRKPKEAKQVLEVCTDAELMNYNKRT
jgi:hypothetical protein